MDSLVKYVNLLVDILTSPLPPKKRKEKKEMIPVECKMMNLRINKLALI